MIIKKSGKNIFGAELTVAERKAMDIEIQKEIAEFNQKNETEIDAVILWILHEHFGFGKKKLKDFYDRFIPAYRDLIQRYEMSDEGPWLCTRLLKAIGVDLETWRQENNQQNTTAIQTPNLNKVETKLAYNLSVYNTVTTIFFFVIYHCG